MLPAFYSSDEVGAPVMNAGAGEVIKVLNKVLVEGYNQVNITKIEIDSGVATVTTDVKHNYQKHHAIKIEGGTSVDGVHRIEPIGDNKFKFPTTVQNTTESPSGATAKRAPLGWVKAHHEGHKVIFKSGSPLSNGVGLYLDNSTNDRNVKVLGVGSFSSITDLRDTFANFPDDSYWKGYNGPNTEWIIVGDDRIFYLFINSYSKNGNFLHWVFGEIKPFVERDVYCSILSSTRNVSGSFNFAPLFYTVNDNTNTKGRYFSVFKDFSGNFSSFGGPYYKYGDRPFNSLFGYHPNNLKGLIIEGNILFKEGEFIRGFLPGVCSLVSDEIRTSGLYEIIETDDDILFFISRCHFSGSSNAVVSSVPLLIGKSWR